MFVNLQPYAYERYQTPLRLLLDSEYLKSFCDEPLMYQAPTLEFLKEFMREMLRVAKS